MSKKIVRLNEARLRQMVTEAVRRIVNAGAYGYPDTVDGIILCSENDRELYNEYVQIAKAVAKVYKRDAKITAERLIDSSIMKRYQQHCFGKYGKENPDKDRVKSPRIFREYVANKIIDEVLNGQWDEHQQVNESQQPDGSYGYQNVPDEFVESLGENGYEVIVPDYCLPYLVNGDMEGYEEDEIQEMQEFEKRFQGKLKNGLTAGDCCIPRDGESPSLYGRNDVFKGDMGSECYRFFLPAETED